MSHELAIGGETGRIVVAARGELDAYAAPELAQRLGEALDHPRGEPVVLDLSATTFLDSTALGAVVGAYRRSRERQVPFSIVAPRGHARRIFHLTGLHAVLPLVDPPPEPQGR